MCNQKVSNLKHISLKADFRYLHDSFVATDTSCQEGYKLKEIWDILQRVSSLGI